MPRTSKSDLVEYERKAVQAEFHALYKELKTEQAVADYLNISQPTVAKAKQGHVGLYTTEKLLKKLRTTLDDLVAKHRTNVEEHEVGEAPGGTWKHPNLRMLVARIGELLTPETLVEIRKIDESSAPDFSEVDWLMEVSRIEASARKGLLGR